MSELERARHPRRTVLEIAVCTGIAIAANRAHAIGVGAPVATLTLFGGIGASSLARRVGVRQAGPIQYGTPLSLGLILLGVQLRPGDLAALGPAAPAWILGYQASVALVLCTVLRRYELCARSRGLLAMGMSGAGLSSVLAVTRSDPAAPKDMTPLVLSGILTTGALGFVALPGIALAVGLSSSEVACWVGICMPTTAEAVLIGAAHSEDALRLTAGWRLLVNALQWVPIALYLAVFSPAAAEDRGRLVRGISVGVTTMRGIPLFVWGLAVVSGLGYVDYFEPSERRALSSLTYWSLLVALAGIGWNTRPSDFLRFGAARIALLVFVWLICVAGLLCCVLLAG